MTAPELVTQIETMHGILAYNGSQVVCACDRTWKPAEDYAAHIARAVLAALTEAGEIEYGVEFEGEVIGYTTHGVAAVNASNPDSALVSRLTLPWGRAE